MKASARGTRAACATEAHEQRTLFRWADLAAGTDPRLRLLLAIPNGAARRGQNAHGLVAQGLRPGVPDLFLACPSREWAGLWIELKRRRGGRLAPEQREWLDRLRGQGYRAEVCKGWEEAREAILAYLGSGGWTEVALTHPAEK